MSDKARNPYDAFGEIDYFSWGLPLQCWVFANCYYRSYLKSNIATTKSNLMVHTIITVIFSFLIVALNFWLQHYAYS